MSIKPTNDAVAVMQADRDAAENYIKAGYTEWHIGIGADYMRAERIALGLADDDELVQAFARHRPAPTPAVSTDEIVATLERCSEIVDHNLHRQREKVEDVPRMLRQLASRLRGEGE